MENEPNFKWNKQIWELIRKIIHYQNNLKGDVLRDQKIVNKLEFSTEIFWIFAQTTICWRCC